MMPVVRVDAVIAVPNACQRMALLAESRNGYCQAGQKTEKANNTGCSQSHLTSRKLRNDHARPINLFLAADKEDGSEVIILAYVFEKLLSSIPAHLEFV